MLDLRASGLVVTDTTARGKRPCSNTGEDDVCQSTHVPEPSSQRKDCGVDPRPIVCSLSGFSPPRPRLTFPLVSPPVYHYLLRSYCIFVYLIIFLLFTPFPTPHAGPCPRNTTRPLDRLCVCCCYLYLDFSALKF